MYKEKTLSLIDAERDDDPADDCDEAFPAAMTSADAATTITDATRKNTNDHKELGASR